MIIKISICFLLLILFSCQNHSSNKNYIKFKIPEQEIKITHHDSSSTNLKSFLNLTSYKCIVFLEGDCGVCLSNLPSINNFLNQHTKTFNAYCSLHNLDISVIYDAPGTIQKTNQLINTNFILLNSENEIITKENPLENSKTKKLYKKLSSSPQ